MAIHTEAEPRVGSERADQDRIQPERSERGAAETPERGNDESITRLLTGIAEDAQALLQQQLTLFQVELKNDLRRTRNAAIPLMAGILVCGLAVVFLCAMLALLLDEVLVLPWWGGFAGVGGVPWSSVRSWSSGARPGSMPLTRFPSKRSKASRRPSNGRRKSDP